MELRREILSIKWSRFTFAGSTSTCYAGSTIINWRGQKIFIRIRSYWGLGPGGLRTHYSFRVNGVNYSYRMIDSHMKGTTGSKPQIENDNLKLVISARPTSLEIIEEEKFHEELAQKRAEDFVKELKEMPYGLSVVGKTFVTFSNRRSENPNDTRVE
jgi:hypothetical protein